VRSAKAVVAIIAGIVAALSVSAGGGSDSSAGGTGGGGPGEEVFTITQTVEIPPRGYHVLRWRSDIRRLDVLEPFSRQSLLPPETERQVERTPAWIQDDLRWTLSELARIPIESGEGARPRFSDVDGDGLEDLVLLSDAGSVRVFRAPGWVEVKDDHLQGAKAAGVSRGDASFDAAKRAAAAAGIEGAATLFDLDGDGVLDLVACRDDGTLVARKGRDYTQELSGFEGIVLDGPAAPAFGDVDGDALSDLVLVTEEGRVLLYGNYGSRDEAAFLVYSTHPRLTFPMDVGYGSRPAFADIDGDGELDLVTGSRDGPLRCFLGPDWVEHHGLFLAQIDVGEWDAPALGDLNGDGAVDLVVGDAAGGIHLWWGPDWHREPSIPWEAVSGYASPAIGDIDGDGVAELIVGDVDGSVTIFEISGESRPGETVAPGRSCAPAVGDVNADGKMDLVIGTQLGELVALVGPDLESDTTLLPGADVGELATPVVVDLDGDGLPEIVSGNLDGRVFVFADVDGRYVERSSWEFASSGRTATIEDYYGRYFPEREELLGWNDLEALETVTDLLSRCPREQIDEVAFALAHTPAEVLRAMIRLGELDLLLENARDIYDMAGRLPYARLVENGEETVLEHCLDGGRWEALPREIYYWWVVHPRILYEVPARIDASYWEKPPEYYGQDRTTWLRHEPTPDIHDPEADGVFWRSALPFDRRYGTTLFEGVGAAPTVMDAIEQLHRWISWQEPGAFMSFGYETQDLQPMVILAKAYGSCGEQSILTAACSRSMLLPTLVVSDRGEDHQWNEFYYLGEWYHWDVNNPLPRGIGSPWVSCEGLERRGKTVSAVTAWRGDDVMHDVTTRVVNPSGVEYTSCGRGYTDTGHLTVVVEDREGLPVDGALVVIKSHWERRNLVSVWGYTDPRGKVEFDLGYEPYGGYTIEVLSPYGTAGTTNFSIDEGRSHTASYRLPCSRIETPPPLPRGGALAAWEPVGAERGEGVTPIASPGAERVSFSFAVEGGRQYRPNFVTHSPYRIGEYLSERAGYRGTRRYVAEVREHDQVSMFALGKEGYLRALDGSVPWKAGLAERALREAVWDAASDAYIIFHNGAERTSAVVTITADLAGETEPPEVTIDHPTISRRRVGDVIGFSGEVSDNLGIGGLRLSFDGGYSWRELPPACISAGGEGPTGVKNEGGGRAGGSGGAAGTGTTWRYEWATADSGPGLGGQYSVLVEAHDMGGNRSRAGPVELTVSRSADFSDQVVRQDDPSSPLPSVSWIWGPLRVPEGERLMEMHTVGKSTDLDVDLYLYRDANRNGVIDGPGEQVATSAGPTAEERIHRDSPEPGTYWLYVQGFDVPGDSGVIDVFSAVAHPLGILRSRSPVGPVNEAQQEEGLLEIRVQVKSVAAIGRGDWEITVDGEDVISASRFEEGWIRYAPSEAYSCGSTHEVVVRVGDLAGNEDEQTWTFVIDRSPPRLTILAPGQGARVRNGLQLLVEARDNEELRAVRYRVGGGTWTAMSRVRNRPGRFVATWDAEHVVPGHHRLEIEAVDRAENRTSRIVRVTLVESGK